MIYVLIQDSSKRSSIIQQVYANLTNPILINLRNPTIQSFDDALWCLYTFSTCFPLSFPNRPFPNGDMWNPQRFTCSWSWMISRKAHPPWAPSLAGFPQWLGVSKSRCFLRVQFAQKVFGGWECWLVFGPKVAWDFLVQKFWRPLRASRKSYTWKSWALVLFEVRG